MVSLEFLTGIIPVTEMSAGNISLRVKAPGVSGRWNRKVVSTPVQGFLYFYWFFGQLHTFRIVCAFVLTSPPPPSEDGDLTVKSVVKVMFIDKLKVCVCTNDYISVGVSIGTDLIGLLSLNPVRVAYLMSLVNVLGMIK
jgi:hypothetical protein